MAPQTPSEIFATNLRRTRGALGWSQEDLAAGCRRWGLGGVTRATIAQIETGRRRVALDEAAVLAYLLQTPIRSLLSTDAPTLRIGTRDDLPARVLEVPTPGLHPDEPLLMVRSSKMGPLTAAFDERMGLAAERLWGHTMMEEVERRLAEGASGGDVRVRRGLLLRRLAMELAESVLDKGPAEERLDALVAEVASSARARKELERRGIVVEGQPLPYNERAAKGRSRR